MIEFASLVIILSYSQKKVNTQEQNARNFNFGINLDNAYSRREAFWRMREGDALPVAPSGRELPTKSGEGECVKMMVCFLYRS